MYFTSATNLVDLLTNISFLKGDCFTGAVLLRLILKVTGEQDDNEKALLWENFTFEGKSFVSSPGEGQHQ